jgi:hypothetical protein
MSTSNVVHRPDLSAIIPAGIAAILGPLPVLGTERQACAQLLDGLLCEFDPQDVIEWLLVWHLVDTDLTILRLRRAKADILRITFKDALATVFVDLLPGSHRSLSLEGNENSAEAAHLADLYFEGPGGREKVTAELAKYGLDVQAIVAQAYVLRGKDLECLDRMLTTATARRTPTVHDLYEHRAMRPYRQPASIERQKVPPLVPEA